MAMLRTQKPVVHLETPDTWADWTDEATWELGPDPEDSEWWAEQDDDGDDASPGPDDPVWDEWADEAAAMDRLERGNVGF